VTDTPTPPSNLTVSAKVDAYLKMYEAQMVNYRATVQIEWRVTIAAWTLLTAISYGAVHENIRLPGYAWVVLLMAPAHLTWLLMIHASEDADKALWVRFRTEALRLLENVKESREAGTLPHGFGVWTRRSLLRHLGWLWAEFGMTLLLTVLAWQLLRRP